MYSIVNTSKNYNISQHTASNDDKYMSSYSMLFVIYIQFCLQKKNSLQIQIMYCGNTNRNLCSPLWSYIETAQVTYPDSLHIALLMCIGLWRLYSALFCHAKAKAAIHRRKSSCTEKENLHSDKNYWKISFSVFFVQLFFRMLRKRRSIFVYRK